VEFKKKMEIKMSLPDYEIDSKVMSQKTTFSGLDPNRRNDHWQLAVREGGKNY
jgi:hypothetical protein